MHLGNYCDDSPLSAHTFFGMALGLLQILSSTTGSDEGWRLLLLGLLHANLWAHIQVSSMQRRSEYCTCFCLSARHAAISPSCLNKACLCFPDRGSPAPVQNVTPCNIALKAGLCQQQAAEATLAVKYDTSLYVQGLKPAGSLVLRQITQDKSNEQHDNRHRYTD